MFLTTPVVVGSLGKAQYGLWVLIISLGNYYFLMNAGVVGALKRYTPQLLVDNDWEGINIQATTTLFFLSGVSLLGLLATGLVVWLLPFVFLDTSVSVSLLRWVLFIAGLDFCLSFLSLSFSGLLYGAQRYDLASFSQIFGGIVRAGLTLGLLPQFPNILTLACIIIFSSQVTHVCAAWLTFREFPGLAFKRHFFRWDILRQSLSFGIFGLMSDIASRLSSTIYPILIGSFLTATHVSYFSIAESLVFYVGRMIGSVSGVLMPTISGLERQNQLVSIQKLVINTTRYLASLSLLAFLNFLFVGYDFLNLWLSHDFAEHSWTILILLSVSATFSFPQSVALNALSGLGFPNIVNTIVWIDAIGLLVGFFVAIPFGGILEISLAYCFVRTFVFLYFIPKNICQKILINPWSYLFSIYGKPMRISVPIAVLFILSKHYIPLNNWLSLICTSVAMSVLFCIFAWFFVVEKSDRIFLCEKLSDLRTFISRHIGCGRAIPNPKVR